MHAPSIIDGCCMPGRGGWWSGCTMANFSACKLVFSGEYKVGSGAKCLEGVVGFGVLRRLGFACLLNYFVPLQTTGQSCINFHCSSSYITGMFKIFFFLIPSPADWKTNMILPPKVILNIFHCTVGAENWSSSVGPPTHTALSMQLPFLLVERGDRQ